MKRFLAAGVGFAAFTTMALAADLPSKVAPPQFDAPPPIPMFTWTGLYVGVQAGYQFGHDGSVATIPGAGALRFGYSPRGIIGGGHIGYNYMVPSAFGSANAILGIEADVDGADDHRGTGFGGAGSSATRSDVKGSIRGRLGVGVDRVLFYATGGAAFADFDTRYNASPVFGVGTVGSYQHSRLGYTVGAGIEYAFMNNFSVRGEYRYSDYGTFVDTLAVSGVSVSHREADNRVQAGFNYKFDSIMPAPVVAKY